MSTLEAGDSDHKDYMLSEVQQAKVEQAVRAAISSKPISRFLPPDEQSRIQSAIEGALTSLFGVTQNWNKLTIVRNPATHNSDSSITKAQVVSTDNPYDGLMDLNAINPGVAETLTGGSRALSIVFTGALDFLKSPHKLKAGNGRSVLRDNGIGGANPRIGIRF